MKPDQPNPQAVPSGMEMTQLVVPLPSSSRRGNHEKPSPYAALIRQRPIRNELGYGQESAQGFLDYFDAVMKNVGARANVAFIGPAGAGKTARIISFLSWYKDHMPAEPEWKPAIISNEGATAFIGEFEEIPTAHGQHSPEIYELITQVVICAAEHAHRDTEHRNGLRTLIFEFSASGGDIVGEQGQIFDLGPDRGFTSLMALAAQQDKQTFNRQTFAVGIVPTVKKLEKSIAARDQMDHGVTPTTALESIGVIPERADTTIPGASKVGTQRLFDDLKTAMQKARDAGVLDVKNNDPIRQDPLESTASVLHALGTRFLPHLMHQGFHIRSNHALIIPSDTRQVSLDYGLYNEHNFFAMLTPEEKQEIFNEAKQRAAAVKSEPWKQQLF